MGSLGRRGFLGTLVAALAVPFARWRRPAPPQVAVNPNAYRMVMEPLTEERWYDGKAHAASAEVHVPGRVMRFHDRSFLLVDNEIWLLDKASSTQRQWAFSGGKLEEVPRG